MGAQRSASRPPPPRHCPTHPPTAPHPLPSPSPGPAPAGRARPAARPARRRLGTPYRGRAGGAGTPGTAARSGSGSPTSARTRPGAGEIAAGPRGRAKLRRGGARGAVSLTVCAPWGGHCAAGGAPRFFGFFFFSSLYFDLLCFGLLGGVSVCFLISFFYFFMLGWGGCWGLLAVPPLLGSRVWPAGCNMSTWGLKSWLIQWDLKAPPWQGAPGQGDTLLPSLGRDGGVQGPKHSISILQEFGWALWGDPTVPPL